MLSIVWEWYSAEVVVEDFIFLCLSFCINENTMFLLLLFEYLGDFILIRILCRR